MPQFVNGPADLEARLTDLIERLYPICRSITGDGVRQTLKIVEEQIPLDIHEVPSGTKVLDWSVPPEWNIRDAYVMDAYGKRVIDFRESNLHVVSYSTPIDTRMTLDELKPHLHSLPDQPDVIPYKTSYYDESWGFCLRHRDLEALPDGVYGVRIASRLESGSLTYGECVVPGESTDEILVSSHVCHPSLCDDNLSGIAVSTFLAQTLLAGPTPRHTVRFLYAPGTIGAIAWLERNRGQVDRIIGGLTLTCLGDAHPFTYKRSEPGTAPIDRAAALGLARSTVDHEIVDFFPYGYDERQFNSPGFRVPIGSLMRGRHGQFPEYHTSADDLGFVTGPRLLESFDVLSSILGVLDRDRTLVNTQPFGEPQLGTRGLYDALGSTNLPDAQVAMLWVLNQSDGVHSLVDIAGRSGIEFDTIEATATVLEEHGLLASVDRATKR